MSRNISAGTEYGADAPLTLLEKENIAGERHPDRVDEPQMDILDAKAGEDEACVRVSFDELSALSDLIDDLNEIQTGMVQMLERFADTLCVFATGTPTAHEVAALHGLAMANAARASEAFQAFERLAELQQVLLERQLDELLRALEEPEADPREGELAECVESR
jgi:hypothetical protein